MKKRVSIKKLLVITFCSLCFFSFKKNKEVLEKVNVRVINDNTESVKVITYNVGLGANRRYTSCSSEPSSYPDISDFAFANFGGDCRTDVFTIQSGQWKYSDGGTEVLENLNSSGTAFSDLRFYDFDGDGKADVVSKNGDQLRYSSAGLSSWVNLKSTTIALSDLRFGDFDGDGKTDVFSKDGNQWRYSSAGLSDWINLNSSGVPLSGLFFHDFNGDGITDILSKSGDQLRYSSSGLSSWINLFTTTVDRSDLRFGDFDGDGKTDVFSKDGNQCRYYSIYTNNWVNLLSTGVSLSNIEFGDFDGDGKTDLFYLDNNEWKYSSSGTGDWTRINFSEELFCQISNCVKPLLSLDSTVTETVTFIKSQFQDNEKGVVCFQEINRDINGVNFLELLKTSLGGNWYYEFFSPIGTDYGIATFTNLTNTDVQKWQLPVSSGQEKRGAIAMKLSNDNGKLFWIINAHLASGLAADRESEVIELIQKQATFSTAIPRVLVGDFNIMDIHRHGSNRVPTSSDITHYENTITELIDSGMSKLEYISSEPKPFTFHSWNSYSNSKILDYILWYYPNSSIPKPEVTTLFPGAYNTTPHNSICPSVFSNNRYLSDHNGIILEKDIFNY